MSRIRNDDPRVTDRIGRGRGHERYRPGLWHERDNFATRDTAVGWARCLARMYPVTPYRVVRMRHRAAERWSVQYVPSWNLSPKGAKS